jgi:thiosulfate/3-mercaptopyruvate sulfurtransferase
VHRTGPFIISPYLPNTHKTEKGGEEMEKKVLFFLPMFVLFALILFTRFALAKNTPPSSRVLDPIVSTDWLKGNLSQEGLVIIDIRSPDDYAAGHIPNALNKPFVDPAYGGAPISEWIIISDDGLLLEVPDKESLFGTIGSLGIKRDSWVVIVTAPNPGEPPFYGLANATRVALTLIYAGVKNVAILDGGYLKWVVDFPDEIDMNPTIPLGEEYQGKVNKAMFVSVAYVKEHIRKSDIIDARDADVYFGVTIEPFADKAGHIPSAKSLPAPWIWDRDENGNYLYKGVETLSAMASGVLPEPWGYKGHRNQEIIVYCGVGGYASSWWFVLTQVLGYQNVKFYDGASQEWVRYYDMVPYKWE